MISLFRSVFEQFKHTPVLNFKPDRRLEMGDRVLALLNDPAEKSDE